MSRPPFFPPNSLQSFDQGVESSEDYDLCEDDEDDDEDGDDETHGDDDIYDIKPVHRDDKRYVNSMSDDVDMDHEPSEDDENKENTAPSAPEAAGHARMGSCAGKSCVNYPPHEEDGTHSAEHREYADRPEHDEPPRYDDLYKNKSFEDDEPNEDEEPNKDLVLVNAATKQSAPIDNADPKPTNFMSLPLEIRNMIYKYLTKDLWLAGRAEWEKDPEKNNGVSVLKLEKTGDGGLGYLAIVLRGAMRPEVLQVCKLISEEYRQHVYRDGILKLHLGDVVPKDLSGVKWNEKRVTVNSCEQGPSTSRRSEEERKPPASSTTTLPSSTHERLKFLQTVSKVEINIHWSAVVGFNTEWHGRSVEFLESTATDDLRRNQLGMEWTPTQGKRFPTCPLTRRQPFPTCSLTS